MYLHHNITKQLVQERINDLRREVPQRTQPEVNRRRRRWRTGTRKPRHPFTLARSED